MKKNHYGFGHFILMLALVAALIIVFASVKMRGDQSDKKAQEASNAENLTPATSTVEEPNSDTVTLDESQPVEFSYNVPSTTQWNEYENNDYGFSFLYPNGVTSDTGYTSPDSEFTVTTYRKDTPGGGVWFYVDVRQTILESEITKVKNTYKDSDIVIKNITHNGLVGVKLTITQNKGTPYESASAIFLFKHENMILSCLVNESLGAIDESVRQREQDDLVERQQTFNSLRAL